ncbi:MAG TPA: MFS transporter [Xanthobacteraceae bacterium]
MSDFAADSVLWRGPLRQFWIARVASSVAWQMLAVAVGWQIYELTNDPLALGLVGLSQFVPALLLLLIAGHVADRYDRRRVTMAAQIVEACAAALLALGTAGGFMSRDLILITVFLFAAGRTFEAPTMQALVPALVPAPLLPRAVAATSSATQAAIVSGPALGGFLYMLSPVLTYALCAVLFLTASVLILLLPVRDQGLNPRKTDLKEFFAGIAYIRRNPVVLGAISLDLFAVLLGGALGLLPIFARDILQTGPWGLGILRASPAVGALALSVLLIRWAPRRHVGALMFTAVAGFGLATIVFALSRSLLLSIGALVVLGAMDMVSVVIRQTLVQLETPDAMRGRVSAVNSLFVGTSNQLGDFRAGTMAALFGSVPSVLIGGISILLVAAVSIRVFPALLRIESLSVRPSRSG